VGILAYFFIFHHVKNAIIILYGTDIFLLENSSFSARRLPNARLK
jgi:hypothetical protein